MSNLTEIIGGQPYFDATAGNSKNKLLDFWKGSQAQYDLLKRTNGAISPAPSVSKTSNSLNAKQSKKFCEEKIRKMVD